VTVSRTATTVGQLPNFLVIGAMKAGTTSLYHYLRGHPHIYMPPVKELDYFAREPRSGHGIDWYRRQFGSAPAEVIAIGEASTLYTKHPRFPGVPERIAAEIPDVRLIYLVRDPIERIRSHYQHQVALGAERAPLGDAVFRDPIYLDTSRYAMQIERYLEVFASDQLLVVASERLRDDREAAVREIYAFLGVDSNRLPAALDREFYRSAGRTTHSPFAWRVRRTLKHRFPALKRAKEFVDAPLLRRRAKAGESASDAFVITDEVRDRIGRMLEDDVRRLRGHLGPAFDGWGIA
jgi:Sulfotransferase domain